MEIVNFSRDKDSKMLCLMFLTVLSCSSSTSITSFQEEDSVLIQEFKQFVLFYEKPYLTNQTEFSRRFYIYKEALKRIQLLNEPYGSDSAPVYGVNKFSDLTPQEFEETYLTGLKPKTSLEFSSESNLHSERHAVFNLSSIPKVVDWRKKSVVTDVRDQKECGACWAFSVVETMESMYAIKYKTTPPNLSVQQLIDCDTGNSGCKGGDIKEACSYTKRNGVVPASDYPLKDRTDVCKELPKTIPRVWVDTYLSKAYVNNEKEVLNLLANHGPVTVAVGAQTWHNYVGGIIQFHCPTNINHAVQIVGYNLEGQVPYYIVRNSWGSNFGEGGYLYVKYGGNLCGIATQVVNLDATKQKPTSS